VDPRSATARPPTSPTVRSRSVRSRRGISASRSAGELLVNDGDDIVPIELDGVCPPDRSWPARQRRITALRRADVTAAVCDYTIVDLSTGQRTAASLERARSLPVLRHVGPDVTRRALPPARGLAARSSDPPHRRPSATATTIDAGELGDVRTPDAWAADSSGVFVAGDDHGLVFRSDRRANVAVIDGLGPLRSVATCTGG
jgi:hypothetical protein